MEWLKHQFRYQVLLNTHVQRTFIMLLHYVRAALLLLHFSPLALACDLQSVCLHPFSTVVIKVHHV